MQSIKTIKNVKGKRVIVRADFNVPTDNGTVLDTTRIQAALPTIDLLRKKGAKVVLISHIGRDPKDSLKPVAALLKKYVPVTFVPAVLGEEVISAVENMKNGDVVLLENLRQDQGEKAGDKIFALALSKLGDIYVNEAFPVSHREDASITILPKLLPHYAGLQFEREVKELSRALNPKHPFLFIQGGAKAETKIPLLSTFLKKADHVFIGGELANDFYKAEGVQTGKSKTDAPLPDLSKFIKSKKLILPATVIVDRDGKHATIPLSEMKKRDAIFDASVESIQALAEIVKKAKLILWNGPMGWYEGGYVEGTEALLDLLAKAKADTIIGGGDTAVLVEKKKMADKFTFVSTGGGATLEFLADGTLPGIKALK